MDSNIDSTLLEQDKSFKKPISINKLSKKTTVSDTTPTQENINVLIESDCEQNAESTGEELSKGTPTGDQNVSLSYIEPTWSGLPSCEKDYVFEVMKSGMIIEKINLMKKTFWVFGRINTADICMAHPTVSRYHAVIQYKAVSSADMPCGYYIFDLGSTHGTFLNKNRIKPKIYVRVQVGHMLRIGCSTRTLLLTGPEEDTEQESEFTITELKQKRAEELRKRLEEAQLEKLNQEKEIEERKKRDELRGIDWGMSEDADEETDLAENPFAETNNEELYIEDPKKALRGFMEREGLELNYDCTEQGMGQFLCRVVLPLDDSRGRPITAEALVKGKKKEAVIQCALEACRILDRHGVLRQATHESKKRKAKNWEENDFYDSDEDTFLDRTGTIELKREKRMKAKTQQQSETYQSLCAKEEKLSEQIRNLEKQFNKKLNFDSSGNKSNNEMDSLDSYMEELNENKPDKYMVAKLKGELVRLKKEHANIVKLLNIARPTHLPPLVVPTDHTEQASSSKTPAKKSLPIFGKRLKVKVMLPSRAQQPDLKNKTSEEEDEVDSDSDNADKKDDVQTNDPEESDSPKLPNLEKSLINCDEKILSTLDNKMKTKISKTVTKLRKIAEEEENIIVEEKRLAVQKRKIIDLVNSTSEMDSEKKIKLSNVLNRMAGEFNAIGDRRIKMVEKINKFAEDINNIAIEIRTVTKAYHEEVVDKMKSFVEKAHHQQMKIFNELKKIEKSTVDTNVIDKLKELYNWLHNQKNNMMENLEKLKNTKITKDSELIDEILEFEKKSEIFITATLEEIDKIRCNSGSPNVNAEGASCSSLQTDPQLNEKLDDESAEKRKKKNQRRIMQRQEKTHIERKKMYKEDASKEDYNMWMPPDNQTGDGRTSLNEKFGY